MALGERERALHAEMLLMERDRRVRTFALLATKKAWDFPSAVVRCLDPDFAPELAMARRWAVELELSLDGLGQFHGLGLAHFTAGSIYTGRVYVPSPFSLRDLVLR